MLFGGLHHSDYYRARVHRVFVLISTILLRIAMFLMKTEAFKWIKKRFTTEVFNNNCSDNESSNQSSVTQELGNHLAATTTTIITTTTITTTTTGTATTSDCLNDVLVVSDTNVDALHSTGCAGAGPKGKEADTAAVLGRYNSNNISNIIGNSRNDSMDSKSNTVSGGQAPIALEEEAGEEEEEEELDGDASEGSQHFQHQVPLQCNATAGVENTSVRRNKSRVRTYLRRFQERLTGHSPHTHPVASPSVGSTNAGLENPFAAAVEREEQRLPPRDEDWTICSSIGAVDEGDNNSYEDIDFDLSTSEVINQAESDLLATIDVRPGEVPAQRLAEQRDSDLAALIDAYLSDIYPVYQAGTRAVLIREARDLLVSQYDGSLQAFERLFLVHFAEIAAALRQKHAVGESIVWCRGWPLATPTGEVILHLGALEAAVVRPSDLYLCIKTVDNSSPRLYAVWRSAQKSDSTLYSRCIDHTDPKIYLSILSLEMMLSEELPQLLQNLLVGVERAIGRLSVNELTSPSVGQQSGLDASNNNNNNNSNNNNNNNINNHISANNMSNSNSNSNNNNNNNNSKNIVASSLASPKCGLKRSELITKNKMLNNKFMLRRLTNRQDSMTSTSSGNSCSSTGSTSSDELTNQGVASVLCNNNAASSVSPALPLFCLGNSFPHIDSDEENADEKRNSLDYDTSLSQEIVAPHAICEIPEKLLTSGIYLPGTRDLKGRSIVTIDAECLLKAGLNCYEIATVLLYYSTIPESNSDFHNGNNLLQNQHQQQQQQKYQQLPQSQPHVAGAVSQQPAPQKFTILIAIDSASHLNAIDLICQSLKLLARHIEFSEILAVCPDRSLLVLSKQRSETTTTNAEYDKQQQQQQHRLQPSYAVKFISVDEVTTSVALSQIPRAKLCGLHHHEPQKWLEFFALLEPFQSQCVATGQRLVTAMNEIRCADMQGLPTRRQLYAQHRALSRALMDSELHNVRKVGAQTLTRLQELAKNINSSPSTNSSSNSNSNNYTNNSIFSLTPNRGSSSSTSASLSPSSTVSMTSSFAAATMQSLLSTTNGYNNNNNNNNNNNRSNISNNNIDVAIRLNKVTLLFNEVDRAAKRLEQLTEQRRERLRELTRQRALEDEINEVTSWITSDGNDNLQRFSNLQLDCEAAFKEHEHEFEKYYFISMKHLAKGRDLHAAANNIDALHESATNLKLALDCFAEKLELARERIEGAARLHQLMTLNGQVDEEMRQEMQRLADKIGLPELLEKARNVVTSEKNGNGSEYVERSRVKPNSLNLQFNLNLSCSRNANGTHAVKPNQTISMSTVSVSASGIGTGSGTGSEGRGACHCWRESRNVEDVDAMLDEDDAVHKIVEEEEQSKIADSGLGGCERCEGNPKLSRICSCQSLNEAGHLYDKGHNSDELDDECFERPSKHFLNIHSPMEANMHLQCHASNLELPKMEELSFLDPKIQKTLLLIMHEMIGTERDYVRSLYYVIENYVDELLRDDITQPLRGQRYVIFGNIENIFEFHNSHFLSELERYESNPLKVGAAFLEMESKFYLYALYNKNKPKSDTLMSEYGTAFFKSKQLELNDKMDLASYLLKPVQRMGKYALLLQQLVKACSSVQGEALQEIAADVEELQRAEEMVKFQLRHGNDLLAMDSLRDCDVNVKEQGRLMRQNEFLVWQGRGGKKTLRQIFLFEELVLFSKARRFPDHKNLDIYIYKNSIKTSDIGLTAHVGDSPTKFEIWFRKRKPEDTWTLQCMSEDIKNAWTEEISKILWKQAKRNRDIRLAEMSSMGIGSKPCLDIRPSNNQISDRSITITQLGKAPKLRHSFVGLHADHGKTCTRPISLVSESSFSSGTSSSSTSTGSSSFSGGKHGTNSNNHLASGLELINETQTLMLAASESSGCNTTNNTNTSTMSSSASSAAGVQPRNHKRSTTLVSQLSMESGILSDISMTPDQEHAPDGAATWSTAGVVMRKKHYKPRNVEKQLRSNSEVTQKEHQLGDEDPITSTSIKSKIST